MNCLGSRYRAAVAAVRDQLAGTCQVIDFDDAAPLAAQLREVGVMLLGSARVTAEVLDAAPRLQLIHQHGSGTDGVDLRAATERGVIVANVPAGNSSAVAEHALALAFYMAKRLYATPASIAGRVLGGPAGIELGGKTLAIIGLGASGAELARRAAALGMRVVAIRARVGEGAPGSGLSFVGGPDDLPRVLREADLVSLHLPLNDRTRHVIGGAQLALMKRSAYLINVARGALVDYDALVSALRDRTIAGAAFDVGWSEPADPADPILALDNFVLTPHVAGFSDVSIHAVASSIAANVRRLQRGEPLVNVVNR